MNQTKLYLCVALKGMLLIFLISAGWVFFSALPALIEERDSSLPIFLDQLRPASLQSYAHEGQVYWLLKRDAGMQASMAEQRADYAAGQEADRHPALMRSYLRSLRADYLLLQTEPGCELLLNDVGLFSSCRQAQYDFSGLALHYPEVRHLPVPEHQLRGNVLLLK